MTKREIRARQQEKKVKREKYFSHLNYSGKERTLTGNPNSAANASTTSFRTRLATAEWVTLCSVAIESQWRASSEAEVISIP